MTRSQRSVGAAAATSPSVDLLATKYILDTDDAQESYLYGFLPELCQAHTTSIMIELAKWCVFEDQRRPNSGNRGPRSRLQVIATIIMQNRPDAVEIGKHLFFLRSASVGAIGETLIYIIKHERFTQEHVNHLVKQLVDAHQQTGQDRSFFLDATYLIAQYHPIGHGYLLTSSGAHVTITLDDLRTRILAICRPAMTIAFHSRNSVDPLSLQAINKLPHELHFMLGEYTFDLVYLGKYLRLTFEHLLDRYYQPSFFPPHPFTKAPIQQHDIMCCIARLHSLWRQFWSPR